MNNVYENQTFFARTFPAGGVFRNCVFYPPCRFGEGSVFEHCRFVLYPYAKMHHVGHSSVFNASTILWAVVEPKATIDPSSTVAYTILLPPTFRAGKRFEEGTAVNFESARSGGGVIVYADGYWTFYPCPQDCANPDAWDSRMNRDGAIYIPAHHADTATVKLDLIKGH